MNRFNMFKEEKDLCPQCHSNDMIVVHLNAINSKGCSRCFIEWDDEEVRDIANGEIFIMEGEP